MAVKDLKISALTKRIAKLEQRKFAYEEMEDGVGATIAQLAIVLYKRDLEEMCGEDE